MIVTFRIKDRGRTVGYIIGEKDGQMEQFISLAEASKYANKLENVRIVNGYYVKKHGYRDIYRLGASNLKYLNFREKIIETELDIGWDAVAYVIRNVLSGKTKVYSLKKAKKLASEITNARLIDGKYEIDNEYETNNWYDEDYEYGEDDECEADNECEADGEYEACNEDEDGYTFDELPRYINDDYTFDELPRYMNAYDYSREQIDKTTSESIKQQRYKETIGNAQKRLEIIKKRRSTKKAGIFGWFEKGAYYEELPYDDISSLEKTEANTKRIRQYRIRENVVRESNITSDGIFRPASISGMTVHIPDEAIAVDAAFLYRIQKLANKNGILASEIVITGGRCLKYIAYDTDEIDRYNNEHYPIELRLKDTKTGFICYGSIDEGITIQPESMAFLKMLINTKDCRGIHKPKGFKIKISRKLLNKEEAALIMCLYENSESAKSRYLKDAMNRDNRGRLFNRALVTDLWEYYRYLTAVPKIDKYSIDREAVRNIIIERIKDAGHKVRDISNEMDWDRDMDDWEYMDAPGLLREALKEVGLDDIEDVCAYDIASFETWKLTEKRAKTYSRIINKAVDLSYNERFIVGCIEAGGILADEEVTQFSLCIDSRCRLRMTKIWDEPGKSTYNRVGDYININDLLNNRWNGSGQHLVKIEDKEA